MVGSPHHSLFTRFEFDVLDTASSNRTQTVPFLPLTNSVRYTFRPKTIRGQRFQNYHGAKLSGFSFGVVDEKIILKRFFIIKNAVFVLFLFFFSFFPSFFAHTKKKKSQMFENIWLGLQTKHHYFGIHLALVGKV